MDWQTHPSPEATVPAGLKPAVGVPCHLTEISVATYQAGALSEIFAVEVVRRLGATIHLKKSRHWHARKRHNAITQDAGVNAASRAHSSASNTYSHFPI